MDAVSEAIGKEMRFGRIDHAGEKANFIMCQEYYDFIEFLQDKLSFEEVNDLQKEFGGSFYNPEFDSTDTIKP